MINVRKKIISGLKFIFPSQPTELFLFLIFFTLYGILGSFIALNYRIIFDDRIPWDAYFSFDNRAIVMTGGGYERHPLANYFFDFIRNFALLISDGKKDEIFRLVLAWCSNFAISLSLVQVYKYLKNIIVLPTLMAVGLVVFFGLFSTNILLSFTPENYTYTLLLLSFFNYYAAKKIQRGKDIPFIPLALSSVAVGGLTITNIVKVYIPILFEKNLFRSWKKWGIATLKVGASAGIFVLLFLWRMNFNLSQIINKTGEQYEKFSERIIAPVWDMILSWFFGGNILFSNFIIKDYHSKQGFEYKALFMDTYSSAVPYVFVGLLLILLLWAYFRQFRNTLVQILMLSFLVDIVIHCILKFGIDTAFVYGGHFVFIYPMMLGWLLYSYRKNATILTAISLVIGIMGIYLLLNNAYRMYEFFLFLERYYQ